MITESKLEALGFHRIVWNRIIPEYWLPLLEPTGDQVVDMNCRLAVKFNELRSEPGPRVWLIVHSMILLPHIKQVSQLLRLYELLTGQALAGVAGGPGEVAFEVGE